jgi:MFS family permease
VGTGTTALLVSVLYVATAIGQPTMGALADRFGPRRIYLLGLALLAAGGLLGFWGPSIPVLLAARVVIGLGTSAAYPAAVAMIRRQSLRLGHEAPGGTLGALAVAAQVSLAIGPPLGGLLIAFGGWNWIFLVNLPLAAIGTLTAIAWLPPDSGGARDAPPVSLADVRAILTSRDLMLTYLRYGLTMTVGYTFIFGWTQWLEQSAELDVALAGWLLSPMFLVGIPTALIVSRRRRIRRALIVGGIGLLLAAASLLLLNQRSSVLLMFAVSVLFGLQNGVNSVSNQAAMYAESPPGATGTAAGLLRTSQYLGAVLSSFLIAVSYGPSASDEGLHELALSLVVVAGLVLLLAAVRPSRGTVTVTRPGFGTVQS